MNTQDQIWMITNQIHEIRLNIACGFEKDYKESYKKIQDLEQQLEQLENTNERD